MPDTADQGTLGYLRQHLEFLVEAIPTDSHPAMASAMRGLKAAIDYKDFALLESNVQALREVIAETADAEIDKHVRWTQIVRDCCEKVWTAEGAPGQEFDDLGKSVEALFDKVFGSIARLKDGWVRLALECGMPVTKAAELEAVTQELNALKDRTLTNWPWTSNGLPPVDRQMVARSRAAIARGEGVPIQDVIRQITDHPSKG